MSSTLQKEFVRSLTNIQSEQEMNTFLTGILTPQEFEELPKRLAIFKKLHEGIAQHTIAKEIGVGIATVTRGSMELKRGHIQKTGWWQSLTSVMSG